MMVGDDLDEKMIHVEQTAVQGALNELESSDPDRYNKFVADVNSAMNGAFSRFTGYAFDRDSIKSSENFVKNSTAALTSPTNQTVNSWGEPWLTIFGRSMTKVQQTGACPAEFATCQ